MNQKNKIMFLSSLIIGVLTLTLGVTFAVFNFNKTSTNSKLIVGDIYMHYNETNQITIDNAMPRDTYDNTKYFEFAIDGKNTTKDKDIWYEIVLTHGDNHATRTTRIRDDLLKFRLVEIKDSVETVVIDNKSYSDLNNHRIWVDTIDKNTTSDITYTYRLYMWISSDTIIGNVSQDYTIDEWNDVYASIKVNVTGDFNEKELAYEDIYNVTDASCFTTVSDAYQVNTNMTEEELNRCATIFSVEWSYSLGEGETWESYCNGTGTIGGRTFQERLADDMFNSAALNYLEENSIIKAVGTGVVITGYDKSCGTYVVIPKTINDNIVVEIGDYAFYYNNLTSVVIPDSVTTIGEGAFESNQLTSVVIPNSVIKIEYDVFTNNNITEVIIPNNVTDLSCYAFDDTVLITKNDDLICNSELPR